MLENVFKQALKDRKAQIGLWASFGDAYATELVASCGFDWLLLDGEHGPNDLRSVLSQLQAAAAYPTHPVVRLPIGDPVLIKQYLDIGAQSLLIPIVESGEQARQLVAAIRYAPRGIRGVASARGSRWGTIPDYYATAEDSICLLLQVETGLGLRNLDEILAVEGVDGIFIGPSDLAASLGYLGCPGHPEVVKQIVTAIDRIVHSGKAAGILATDQALAHSYLERGVTFCAVGVDTLMLAQAAQVLARQFKTKISAASELRSGATY